MRRNIIFTVLLFSTMLLVLPIFAQKPNQLTNKEKKDGWVLLFNGKNFDGWRQCNGTTMPAN